MSNHNNMTGHYHVAGRERQGEDILQSAEKGAYARQRQEARREAIEAQAGPPAWETTPPNLEIAEEPRRNEKQRPRKTARRTRSAKPAKPVNKMARKTARKAAPRRKALPGRKAAGATSRSARKG